jgi:hypothetical protein
MMAMSDESFLSCLTYEARTELFEQLYRYRQCRLPFDERAIAWNQNIVARPRGRVTVDEMLQTFISRPYIPPEPARYHP